MTDLAGSSASSAASLNDDELAQYREQGFVVPRFRLSAERVGILREALDRVIQDNPDTRPEQLVSVHIAGKNAEGVTGHETFMDIASDERIVDAVSQLIGPDVILWGCQSFCKPPGDGMEVPFHQDGNYWPIRPLATCTVWIAIDDSVVENGCLRVIPGSHRDRQLVDHLQEDRDRLVLNQRVVDGVFDENDAVEVELEAGQMSMHDVYMIHGSNPNLSSRRRAGLAIRYMPGTSLFARDSSDDGSGAGYAVYFSTRPIWLLRGEDRTGQNDFEVGK